MCIRCEKKFIKFYLFITMLFNSKYKFHTAELAHLPLIVLLNILGLVNAKQKSGLFFLAHNEYTHHHKPKLWLEILGAWDCFSAWFTVFSKTFKLSWIWKLDSFNNFWFLVKKKSSLPLINWWIKVSTSL